MKVEREEKGSVTMQTCMNATFAKSGTVCDIVSKVPNLNFTLLASTDCYVFSLCNIIKLQCPYF